MSLLLRLVTGAYRSGTLPPRGTGVLFDRTPQWLWGGASARVTTPVGDMLVPIRDHGPRQILVFGQPRNEIHETQLLTNLASRITCALDVGANVGWYTRVLGRAGARVLACEPNRQVLTYLLANCQDLDCVDVLDVAVGRHEGVATFYEASSSDLSSASRPVGRPVDVQVTTVDAIVSAHGVRPDLVKCDVEGGEIDVLQGARQLRGSPDAPLWLLEADERFLLEQGASYDDLQAEVSTPGLRTFYCDRSGRWVPLARFTDLRGTDRVNVLVVPERRMNLVADMVSVAEV